MKIRSSVVLLVLAILGLLLLSACSKKEEQASNKAEVKQAPAAAPATPVDPATAATITGTVKYPGAAPKPVKIDMSQDPACKGGDNTVETLVVNKGNLENAFVYVKDGLGSRTFDTPKDPVTLDQKGCRYHPHVVGIMTGQTLKVINSDDTTHNIHPTPKDNREWNESQPPKAAAIEKTFAREEIMLPVKCNQHPWMKMYVNVVKSPYFAVTDKDGKYTLKGLPPGTYTIAVVHEKLGTATQQVTVGAKESKAADFTMKAAQ
ncbi:MAG TPA: carboxypeptidase regulatory-like domain-containing protein [Terriglobales bacterium]